MKEQYNESGVSAGFLIKIGVVAFIVITLLVSFFGLFGRNLDQNWQYVQYPLGGTRIVNEPGFYLRWFGTVTTYPRNWQVEYNALNRKEEGDWSTKVTFNDGGWAHMDAIVRFASPSQEPAQRAFHRLFAGSEKNVEAAVWAHMADSMKSSGPIMSTSEHQSARRSEFNALVQEQIDRGLFEMRKVERKLLDTTDEKGKAITVYATEVILDERGKPVISKPSPLTEMGIKVTQFSITDVRYDDQTVKQFVTKKEAFLAAENSKAQREKEVQERLMILEKSLKEKAEVEGLANKQKATETINADREKIVAETNAARDLAVAELTKKQAEVRATQEKITAEIAALRQLEVAKLERQAAEENAKKQISLAEAQKKSLELAGAISERERVLAEIARDRDVRVAEQLAKIATPSIVFNGNSQGGNSMTENLLNIRLIEASGLLMKLSEQKK